MMKALQRTRWAPATVLALIIPLMPTSATAKANLQDVKALIDAAAGLQPEYRADIQLNAIEAVPRLPRNWTLSVLHQLFRDAGSLQDPFKQRDVTGDNFSLSRRLDFAFTLNLDSLSVRTRVIKAVLPLDPAEARVLAAEVPLLIPQSNCDSPFVYDVSNFYAAIGEVAARTFSPEELKQGARADFLEEQIRNLNSSVQLAPFAKVLATADLTEEQANRLVFLFSQALGRLKATDRELAFLEESLTSDQQPIKRRLPLVKNEQTLNGGVRALLARSDNHESMQLLQSYRLFLMKSSTAGRCADIFADRVKIAKSFNQIATQYGGNGIESLSPDELTSKTILGSARLDKIPNGATISQGLTKSITGFRAWQSAHFSDSDPGAFQNWEADANELLGRIEGISPAGSTCPDCIFQEKAEMIFALFSLVPEGETKNRVFEHLVSFMARSPLQQDRPIEWLYRLNLLLNLCRTPAERDAEKLRKWEQSGRVLLFLPEKNAAQLREIMMRENNAVIQEYVSAERILKSPFVFPPY